MSGPRLARACRARLARPARIARIPDRFPEPARLGQIAVAFAVGVLDRLLKQERQSRRSVRRSRSRRSVGDGRRAGRFASVSSAAARLPLSTEEMYRARGRQGLRVVPIEQVALEALHALDRREREIDAFGEIVGPDESAGRAPTAWRAGPCRCWSATCDARRSAGRFLKVVRRQAVVVGDREGVEVAPGLAGRQSKKQAIVGPDFLPAPRDRLAEPVREQRRGNPQQQDRQRRRQRARPQRATAASAAAANKGLPSICSTNSRVPDRVAGPCCRAEVAAVCHSSILRCVTATRTMRDDDRVRHLAGLVGEEDHLQKRPRQRGLHVVERSRSSTRQGCQGRGPATISTSHSSGENVSAASAMPASRPPGCPAATSSRAGTGPRVAGATGCASGCRGFSSAR